MKLSFDAKVVLLFWVLFIPVAYVKWRIDGMTESWLVIIFMGLIGELFYLLISFIVRKMRRRIRRALRRQRLSELEKLPEEEPEDEEVDDFPLPSSALDNVFKEDFGREIRDLD